MSLKMKQGCERCEVPLNYESVEKQADSTIAVNARMLEAVEVAAVPLRYFDGAVTWKYISR
jgi:hypothetical protein